MSLSQANKKQEVLTKQEEQLESSKMRGLSGVICNSGLWKMLGMQKTKTKRMVSAHERGIET